MRSYRAEQPWHLYENEMPGANDFGCDFEDLIDSHMSNGHTDSLAVRIMDTMGSHGLPMNRALADDIIQANLESELQKAGEQGGDWEVFNAVRKNPYSDDYDDAMDMAHEVLDPSGDMEVLPEILASVDELVNPTRKTMDNLAREYGDYVSLSAWKKMRQRCFGTHNRDWFRDRFDSFYHRKIQRRSWRKNTEA